ncbi:MAG TPA: proprotein convertase P-domain-containing protein [Thermoguttaceae bacterium]|nr:proprotein convertase P-domain-containing protein [Thermoguttaceae bacterium]
MSLLRSPKLRSLKSTLESIRDRWAGKSRPGAGQMKHRRLTVDPLEERVLLSVVPADYDDVLVNQYVGTEQQGTTASQSVAVDNDGDFVVVWTRYDDVLKPDPFNPGQMIPVIDPATGDPMLDANIYARYFTDEVQRLTLPQAIAGDGNGNGVAGSFSLVYGGNEVQKISITATYPPATMYARGNIAGAVTFGFDVNDNGIVGPGETTTVFFNEGTQEFTQIAADFQTHLQGLGGALTDVTVTGINPHEYTVEFGDLSMGLDQPEITVESVNFTSGFLPAVITSTEREPIQVGPIFVSSTDPYQTANAIQEAFLFTSQDYVMGPILFPPAQTDRIDFPEGPYDYPDVLRSGTPGATVTPVWELDPSDNTVKPSTTKFDITFDGGRAATEGASGKRDHPLLVVSAATADNGANLLPSAEVDVRTLKEPGPEFRVNPAEPDNPFTRLPDRYNQLRPDVGMDSDGEFVITWESVVPNVVQHGTVSDIFARRFAPVGTVPAGQEAFSVDTDFDGIADTPIQGVKALDGGFRVNTTTTGVQAQPAIGVDAEGNFVIAWGSGNEGFPDVLTGQEFGYFNGIHAQRFNRKGETEGDQFQVNTEATLIHFEPYVAMSDDGYSIITWSTTNDENFLNTWDIRLVTTEWRVFGPDGAQVIPQRSLGTGGGSAAAFDDQNNFIITWDIIDDTDNTGGNRSSGVRAVMYDIDGNVLRVPTNPPPFDFRVNSANFDPTTNCTWPGGQWNAEPALDADGDLVVSYEGVAPDVSDDVAQFTGRNDAAKRVAVYRRALIDLFHKPENADLLQYFDPAVESFPISGTYFDQGGSFVSLGSTSDYDTDLENLLIRASTQPSPATDVQLGRIRALVEQVAGLLQGELYAVMFSRFDADPVFNNSDLLYSDSVANNKRDGHNHRYILTIPSTSTGGSFGIRISNQYTGGTEDVSINPTYTSSVLQIGPTREEIEDKLQAATRTGLHWDSTPASPTDNSNDFDGSVEVRVVSSGFGSISSEVSARQGTPWEYTILSNQVVYEIVFEGEVHDSYIGLSIVSNQLSPDTERQFVGLRQIMYPDGGTTQTQASIGIETDGDYVMAWTQNEEFTTGGVSNQNIYYRRFTETTDTAGPKVSGLSIKGEALLDGESASSPVSHAVLAFDEQMLLFGDDSATNPENYRLFANGIEIDGGIVSVQFGMNKAADLAGTIDAASGVPFGVSMTPTNKWEAVITLDGDPSAPGVQPLLAGTYTIEALAPIPATATSYGESGLRDSVGNPLASRGFLPGGQNLSRDFIVVRAPTVNDDRIDVIAGVNGRTYPESAEAVAVDADGDHVVVWTAKAAGKDRVFYCIYDADGASAMISPLEVALFGGNSGEFTNDDQRYGTVAVDEDGDFVVTWTNYRDGDADIYARRFNAEGEWLGDAFLVNAFGRGDLDPSDPTRTHQKWSQVALDADGDFVITWASYAQEKNGQLGTGYGIYARKYNAQVDRLPSGAIIPPRPATPEFRVNTTTAGHQSTPTIAMDADGNFVIGWTSAQGGLSDDIVCRVFTSDGAPIPIAPGLGFTGWQAGEILVNQTTDGAQRYPKVAMDLGGRNFVVTWSSSGQDGSGWGIYGRTFAIPTTPSDPFVGVITATSTEFRVNTSTLANQLFSSVAMDHQGQFVITWSGYGNQFRQEDESGFGVFFQRYNPSPFGFGVIPVGLETRMNQDITGDQWLPSVEMDGEGNFVAVWTGVGVPTGVYRYQSAGVQAELDNDPPIVTDVLFHGDRVFPGGVLDSTVQPIDKLEIVFGEGLSVTGGKVGFDSVLNPLNWALERDGGEVIDWIASVNGITFTRNASRKYVATITFDTNGPLPGTPGLQPGAYSLTALSSITDGRNELDGDYDGIPATSPGRGFVLDFFVSNEPTNGPEFRVNQETRYLQHVSPTMGTGFAREENKRSVAVDHDGDFVVVWTSYGQDDTNDPQGAGVYMRMYDRNDEALTNEIRVNTTFTGDQRNASVAMDADGDFIIVWEAKNVYADGTVGDHPDESWGIYGRRFNAHGDPVISDTNRDGIIGPGDTAKEFRVNTDTLGDQTDPAVAVDSYGNFVATWVHTHGQNFSFFHDVNAQRYSRRGELVGGEFRANSRDIPGVPGLGRLPSGGGGTEVNPQVALDDGGNIVLVWELITIHDDGAWLDTLIVGRLFDSDGQPRVNAWTGDNLEFQISPDTIENTPTPAFGNFQSDPEHYEHQNPVDQLAPTDLQRTARNPQIVMDDQGNFIVVWESHQDNDIDEDPNAQGDFPSRDILDWDDSYGIYFRMFGTDGAARGYYNANMVNTGGGVDTNFAFAQVNPSVAIDGDGDFAVVWNGNGAEPTAFFSSDPRLVVNHDNEGVFVRWFQTGNGGRPADYVTQQQRVNYTEGGVQHFPSIAMEPDGDSIVVWNGAGPGDPDGIFARRYDEPVDNAGPRAFEMWQPDAAAGPLLVDGTEDVEAPEYLIVVFDEDMWTHAGHKDDGTGDPWGAGKHPDSVENPDNWLLMRAGEEFEDAIATVKFGLNRGSVEFPGQYPETNKYEAVVTFVDPLPGGDYTLTALRPVAADPVAGIVPHSGLRDAIGNPLSRTGLVPDGSDVSFLFTAISEGKGGKDEGVGPGTTYAEAQGAVASDADGDYVIAWTLNDGFHDHVFVRLYDADGTPADLDLNHNGFVANEEDTDGDGIVDPEEDRNGNGLWDDSERDNAVGVRVTTDPSFASDDQRFPTIACDADGDFIVTWTNYRGGDADVYAKRFFADGTSRDNEATAVDEAVFRVNAFGRGDLDPSDPRRTHQKWSEVDMDPDGDFVITWSSYAQESNGELGTGYGVYARRYDSFGQPLAPEFRANVTTEGNQRLSNVAVDSTGGFVIVWASDQNGVGTDIVARSFWPDGSPQPALGNMGYLFGEFVVNTTTNGNQDYPDVDMNADGSSYVVTWTGPDGNHTGVYGRQISRQTLVQAEPRATYTADIPPEGILIPHAGFLTWTLEVTESFSITDLDVALQILHPRPSDLTVSLVSPSGTLVTLADRVPQQPTGNFLGGPGDPGNFVGTVFDDEALIAINQYPSAQPPFTGRFVPAPGTLAAFDGEQVTGLWELRIVDSRPGPYAPDWNDPLDPAISAYLKEWSIDVGIGLTATDEFLVNSSVNGVQTYSSIAMDHRGDFVVTWSGRGDRPGQEDLSGQGVFYQQFSLSASRVGSETRVNYAGEGNQWLPSISSDGAGNFVVVWTGPPPEGVVSPANSWVYKFDGSKARSMTDNDGPWVTDVLTSGRDSILNGDVLDPMSVTELVVVFGEELSTREVLFDTPPRDGSVDRTEPGPDGPYDLANWTLLRNGQEIPGAVTEVTFGWNNESRKYEAAVTLDGNPLTPVNDPLPVGNYVLAVLDSINDRYRYRVQPDGAFIAEYEDPFFGGNALDGDFDGTPGTRLDGTGYNGFKLNFGVAAASQQYGAEFRVNESTGAEQRFGAAFGTGFGYEQSTRSVAVDHDGDFAVVWTSYGEDDPTDPAGAGVYVRMYDRNNDPILQPDPSHPGQLREMPPLRVNLIAGGEQRNAAVAIDADGEFVVVWEARNEVRDDKGNLIEVGDNADGSWGIYGQRFSSVGVPIGDQFRVNTSTQQDQLNPAAAMDEFGNFVVVWATKGQPFSYFNDVRGQVFNYEGDRVGSEFLVNQVSIPGTNLGPGSIELNPAVGMAANGDFVVAWDQVINMRNGAAIDSVIVGRLFNPDGTPRVNAQSTTTDEFQVNVGDDSFLHDPEHTPENAGGGNEIERQARNPQIAVDGAGEFIIVWEAFQDNEDDASSGADSYGVYFRRYDADGTEQWDHDHQANLVITIDTSNVPASSFNSDNFAFGQVNPSVAMDADGDYAVVWNGNGAVPHPLDPMSQSVTNADTEGVWIRQFHARDPEDAPEFVGVQTRVNVTSGGIQQFPTIGMEPDGDRIVVWSGGGVGDRHGIYFRRYDEPTDTAGPKVSDITTIYGERIGYGGQVTEAPNYIVVVFDEKMMVGNPSLVADSVLNTANYSLVKDGTVLIGGIQSVQFDLNKASKMFPGVARTNKWEAVIELDGNGTGAGVTALPAGQYEIIISGTLRDVVGNPLSSSGLNPYGSDNIGRFNVVGFTATTEEPVNPSTGGDQVLVGNTGAEYAPRAVASDGDGEFVVVWTDTTSGGVYARVYNDLRWSGTAIQRVSTGPIPDDAFQVTNKPTAMFASVARDSDGDFVVTWEQNDGTAAIPNWNVWARRYDAEGRPFDDAFRVNSVTEGHQRYAAVAMDVDGDFVVTWQSSDTTTDLEGRARDGDGYGVYAQRFSPSGQRLGGADEVQVLTFSRSPAGTFTLFWDGDDDPSTANVTAPIRIDGNPAASVDQIEAQLSVLGGDVNRVQVQATSLTEVIVYFVDQGAGRNQEQIVVANTSFVDPVSDVTASTLLEGYGGEFLVNDTTANNQMHPSVAMSAEGDFVISWTSFGQDGDAANQSNIYAKKFASNDAFRYAANAAGVRDYDYNARVQYPDAYFAVSTDNPDNHVVNPASGYDGVVQLIDPLTGGSGTGSLLRTGRHILTAAHVVDFGGGIPTPFMEVKFDTPSGPTSIIATDIIIHPGWNGDILNANDLAIIVLPEDAPAEAERYDLYRGGNELNQRVDMVGYGVAGQGAEQFYDGQKRIEWNEYEAYGDDLNGLSTFDFLLGIGSFDIPAGKLLIYDFDSGLQGNDALGMVLGIGDLGLGQEEGTSSHGDSGGPTFINGMIAGVVSGGSEYLPADSDAISFNVSFGTVGFHTRVSAYADWIDMITQSTSGEFLVNDVPTAPDPITGLPVAQPTGNQKWSSAAMDADGDFVITWTDELRAPDPNEHLNVMAKRFNADATEFEVTDPTTGLPVPLGEFQVNTAGDASRSQAAMDVDGDFVIVWANKAQRYAKNDRVGDPSLGPNGELGGNFTVFTGTPGLYASVAVDDTGDTVFVREGYDSLIPASLGIFYKRSEASEDDAGPMVADVINVISTGTDVALQQLTDGVVVDEGPTTLIVSFSEDLIDSSPSLIDSITNRSNWILTRNGQVLSGGVAAVQFGLNQTSASPFPILPEETNKYEAVLMLDGDPSDPGKQPLGPGTYVLRIRSYVEDQFGNRLDGDYDGSPDGDFRRTFIVSDEAGGPALDGDRSRPGDPDPDYEDKLVNFNDAGNQDSPAVASDASGNYVVAWVETADVLDATGAVIGVDSNIKARRYDRFGNPIGGEFIVNSYRTGDQLQPAVAMNAFGSFVVTWSGEGEVDDQGTIDRVGIFARVFDAFGQPLAEQFIVNQSGDARKYGQTVPSVAMDDRGDFAVTWTSYGQDGDQDGVYARRYDYLGEAKGDEFPVNTTVLNRQADSDIAMDEDGNFTIVWSAFNQPGDGSEWGVVGRRYSAAGAPLSGQFLVNTFTLDDQTDAHVGMDADGNFVVVWASDIQDGSDWGVYARRYGAGGAALGSSFRVNQTTLYWQFQPDVSMSGEGDFVVTWTTVGQDNPDAADRGIYARAYDVDGNDYVDPDTGLVVGEFQVNANVIGNQTSSAVALDADGDFAVVWTGPDADANGVYHRHFRVNAVSGGGTGGGAITGSIGGVYFADGASGGTSTVLNLPGTSGDDRFEFYAGPTAATSVVLVNGVRYAIRPEVLSIRFDGQGGHDEVVIKGTALDETVDLYPDHAAFSASRYNVSAANVEWVFALGGGGTDFAILHDNPEGKDTLKAWPGIAKLYGDGFYTIAKSFSHVHAYGTEGSGDMAVLYDDPHSADTFKAWPSEAKLYGDGFYNKVASFDSVYAFATAGGGDTAVLYDDPGGKDTFKAWPTEAKLYGTGFFNRVSSFSFVHAFATEGDGDVAVLYDDPDGVDTFKAWPNEAKLYANGGGFFNRAKGFDSVYGYATKDGGDTAVLYDSPGVRDTFKAWPSEAKLYGEGFYNKANAFSFVHAYATEGDKDTAVLYDDPSGQDTLKAWPNEAKLYGNGGGFFNRAKGFYSVYAYATPGGNDVAKLYDSPSKDTLVATPESVKLYNGVYYNRASAFAKVYAYSTSGGSDKAYLNDSALEEYPDHVAAAANRASLSNELLGYAYWVSDFEEVVARQSNASDTEDVNTAALDFLFSTERTW